jgi:hypothetical protein
MRDLAFLGDLLPVLVPGGIVLGAASTLVLQTPVGTMIFTGPTAFLVVSLLVGTLVLGYLVGGLQELLAGRVAAWALPPTSHLDEQDHTVELPRAAVERAGFRAEGSVHVRLGLAYALERSLAGAWGTPEGGWDRAAFLQRVALALGLSAGLAVGFLVAGVAGGGLDAGLRSHGGTVLLLGGLAGWLVAVRAGAARREAVLELLADARAMIMDRGEHQEVRRILDELGLSLAGEEPAVGVPR